MQEVLRFQVMTPIPKAPPAIEGLINLRGQIVTAIDMRRWLGLPPRDGKKSPMNIVIRTSEGAVSLLVDEIGDVLDVDAATYERSPESLDPGGKRTYPRRLQDEGQAAAGSGCRSCREESSTGIALLADGAL